MTVTLLSKPPSFGDTVEKSRNGKRRARWRMHDWLRDHSERRGAKLCMQPGAFGEYVEISVTQSGAAHLAGIQRCGSPHSCPLCAPVVREKRADQLDTIFARALAEGHHLVMVTATVQHSAGWELAPTLAALQASWTAGFGGRSAQWSSVLEGPTRDGSEFLQADYIGQVRALDFTHSPRNGWHPHIHAVLIFHRDTTEPERNDWLRARRTAFRKKLHKLGYYSADNSVGWHVMPIVDTDGIGQYSAKVEGGWGAGLELARGDAKTSRHIGGATPFELLRSAALMGDADDGRLFLEYEAATLGRRLITVARRIKELFGQGVSLDQDDAELAAQELAEAAVYTKLVLPAEWSYHVNRGTAVLLLESVVNEARALGLVHDPPS